MSRFPVFTLTWIQDGNYEWATLRYTHDVFKAIGIFVNGGMEYLPDSCTHNALFCDGRLIARQATYQGVS